MADNKLQVAPDVPQELLDAFNKIDFEKAGAMKKALFYGLQAWANKHMPKKDPKKNYLSNGVKKKVSRDFDPKLLMLINLFDYEGQDLTEVIEWLEGFIREKLPLKQPKGA